MENTLKPFAKKRLTQEQAFSLNGKIPPQAIDLEEAVLGALMLDQNAVNNSIEIIRPEFFYEPKHQYIFTAVRHLFDEGKPVDILTVVEKLRSMATLELSGGAYYITQLTNRVTSGAHIEFHARVLSEKFIQRELIRISTETISEAYDETTDVVDLLDKTEQRLMDINDNNFRSDYRDMHSLLLNAMEEIENAQKAEGNISGVPTGFVELDRHTGGFQRGTLIILAARPAMGKTALALSMARNMAVDFKKPIAFFSLEMTALELVMRLISSESEISADLLKKGEELKAWQQEQLAIKIQPLNDAPIYIDDTPQLTIFELRAKCRRLKQRHDIQMVFIDYLQLMHASGDGKGNREQEISTISRQLKALSKELNIPVLALSQLSRAVETRGGSKKPMLSDLRESGAIEQDADIVMFIYRPEYYGIQDDEKGNTTGMADVIIAKHRSGAVGEVRLKFVSRFARFENPDFDSFGDNMPITAFGSNENFDEQGNSFSTVTIPSKMNIDDNFSSNMPQDDDYPF